MIALKQAEIYDLVQPSMVTGLAKDFFHYKESAIKHNESVLEEPISQLQAPADNIDCSFLDRKSSRILEQRLLAMRRELEQQVREHSHLLNIAHSQAERLSIIEPLPGLFLARLEDVLRLLGTNSKDSNVGEIIHSPEELDRRFNQAITQLRLIFDRDKVLENKELKEALTKIHIALELKREEVLQLRLEQEQLNQKLIATMEKLQRFDVEVASREERIAKLQKYVKESEARHHRLFVDRRAMRNKPRAMSAVFTFANNPSGYNQNGRWQLAPIILGLTLGCTLTLAAMML